MGLALKKAGIEAPPRAAVAVARPKTAFRTIRERFSKGEVEWSRDLERISALPRREKPEMASIIQSMTARLKKPEGKQVLREVQAWALHEVSQVNGLVMLAATGSGKTLALCLSPMMFPPIQNADGTYRPVRAALFVPPSLKPQLLADWEVYGKHWKLPNLAGGRWFVPGLPVVHIVSYSELSNTKSSALLFQIKPDIVMGDEISSLRNFETSRTRRMRAFLGAFPDCRFIGADATIVSDSIEDFWAPMLWALDVNSPVPLEQSEMKRWARAIDPKSYDDGYYMPGKLMSFCEAGEHVRSGFQRRLVETAGVVATKENALGIPLSFIERKPPKMPDELKKLLADLRRKPANGGWKRPDGEEFRTDSEVAACAKQLAQGFWLHWAFPRSEPDEVIDEWFRCRQNWNRELRAKLARPGIHMDSPALCENAAARWYDGGCTGCDRGPREPHTLGCRDVETHPLWNSQTFLDWRMVKDTVVHETRVKWESDWLLKDAASWAMEKPGIVWVRNPEFGHKLSKMTGCRYYGGGDEANKEIATEYTEAKGLESKSIICSVMANFKGRNLQYSFSRNLIVSFPSKNDILEQLVGRTVRPGQALPVSCHYYAHTPELEHSIDTARTQSKFVFETLGSEQKMVWGTWE